MELPRITASAVVHCGHVYQGKRHNNAIENAVNATNVMPVKGCQGFVTDEGKFIDRQYAMILARKNGQLLKPETTSDILFSEDLW